MKQRYHTLDAIRGVAAFCVVMLHGSGWFGPLKASGGYLAVDLFFALSGFIIADVYEPRFAAGLTARAFIWQRAVRFWPLYMLGTLIGLFVAVIATPSWWLAPQAAGATLFLPSGATHLYPLNKVAWSLGLELLANLVFVLVWRSATVRNLLIVIGLSAVVLVLVALRDGNLEGGFALATLDTGLARVTFSFSLGVLLYRLLPRLRHIPFPAWILVLLPYPLMLRSFGPLYDLALVMIAFPILLLLAAKNQIRSGVWLASGLGLASYALYAVHKPLTSLIDNAAEHVGINLSEYAVWSGLVLGAAFLLGSWILGTFDDKLQDHLKKRRAAKANAVPASRLFELSPR
ncbi:acyltransferase family protein [Sphingomonas sp. PB4P5]|uniref:acyltransferase family protein n=1 Tax=Parasphingomonas puruogangriensis TaxID=3096155 RepID=UPI002FC598A7